MSPRDTCSYTPDQQKLAFLQLASIDVALVASFAKHDLEKSVIGLLGQPLKIQSKFQIDSTGGRCKFCGDWTIFTRVIGEKPRGWHSPHCTARVILTLPGYTKHEKVIWA